MKESMRYLGRMWPVLAAVALAGCASRQTAQTGDGLHKPDTMGQYGSLLDRSEFGRAPKALPASAFGFFGPLPLAVILTNTPSISMQGTLQHLGSPGSCEAQSFGYGLGTTTIANGAGFDASKSQNQVSAAYMYKWAHFIEGKACPSGSGALIYLETLVMNGAPNANSVPYIADCTYLDSVPIPTASDPKLFLGSFATLQIEGQEFWAVDRIKEFLANGQAVAFSGLVLEGYASGPNLRNGVIYDVAAIPGSGHGQFIVGYDDTIGDPLEPGAFLVQNSFGTLWPKVTSPAPPGMVWWSYRSFRETQKLAAVAYPRTSIPVGATLEPNENWLPQAVIQPGYQYAFDGMSPANLIFRNWFSEPVELLTIRMTEPGEHAIATESFIHNVANGYTYISRRDGFSFLSGDWRFEITVKTQDGRTGSYSGIVHVGDPVPGYDPRTMAGAFISGTTGGAVDVMD